MLTNGIEYRFFTDTGDPNVMDSAPFYIARLDAPDQQGFEVLARFHKAVFSPRAIRDFATELIYTARIISFLRCEPDLRDREASDTSYVGFLLASASMKDGSRRMFEAGKHATSLIFDPSQRREVPGEFEYKDTTGYLAVYLNKPSWWCVRLVTETRQPWVGFNVPERIGISLMPAGSLRLDPHPYAEFRLALANPEDLLTMAALMDAAIANTLSERRSGGDAFAAHG